MASITVFRINLLVMPFLSSSRDQPVRRGRTSGTRYYEAASSLPRALSGELSIAGYMTREGAMATDLHTGGHFNQQQMGIL